MKRCEKCQCTWTAPVEKCPECGSPTPPMTYTREEAAAAFEWLRAASLVADIHSHHAAIMFTEIARLKAASSEKRGPSAGDIHSMTGECPTCGHSAHSSAIGAPVATVINNNQPGWTAIVETAPNVTLDVGAKLHLATTRNTVIDECIAALDSRGLASVYADGTNTARTILCALKAT